MNDDGPDLTTANVEALLSARAAMLRALGLPEDAVAADTPDLLMQALVAAATQPDPAARARVLTTYLGETQKLIDVASGIRNEAIRSLRVEQTASYEDIAELLGISKSRAQQLCKRLENQDLSGRRPSGR